MSDIAIRVENLGKKYHIGGKQERYSTLRDSLVQGISAPFKRIGGLLRGEAAAASDLSEEIWALKDVSFDIKHGDIVGIIGRNGAGKSTLLKILSQITEPTTGRAEIYGRVGALLEVGTGFHPELTGRENIFLNGAILGMRRKEMERKFDEIVDFSGVEKFIDTPVKHYSSGMQMRLAFAVAAHLEPEILIVDEVLAVGDAEFQKKCMGKMGEVAKGGRTVLFVSHNLAAVESFCVRGVMLDRGSVICDDIVSNAIDSYIGVQKRNYTCLADVKERKGNGNLIFTDGQVEGIDTDTYKSIQTFSDFKILLKFSRNPKVSIRNFQIDIGINNHLDERIAWLSTSNTDDSAKLDDKDNSVEFIVRNCPLAPGEYNCNLFCAINGDVADWIANVLSFTIVEKDYYGTGKLIPKNQGDVLLEYEIVNP